MKLVFASPNSRRIRIGAGSMPPPPKPTKEHQSSSWLRLARLHYPTVQTLLAFEKRRNLPLDNQSIMRTRKSSRELVGIALNEQPAISMRTTRSQSAKEATDTQGYPISNVDSIILLQSVSQPQPTIAASTDIKTRFDTTFDTSNLFESQIDPEAAESFPPNASPSTTATGADDTEATGPQTRSKYAISNQTPSIKGLGDANTASHPGTQAIGQLSRKRKAWQPEELDQFVAMIKRRKGVVSNEDKRTLSLKLQRYVSLT